LCWRTCAFCSFSFQWLQLRLHSVVRCLCGSVDCWDSVWCAQSTLELCRIISSVGSVGGLEERERERERSVLLSVRIWDWICVHWSKHVFVCARCHGRCIMLVVVDSLLWKGVSWRWCL
jgi:hypothetical protein